MIVPPQLFAIPIYPLFIALAICVGGGMMLRAGAGARSLPLLLATTGAGLLGAKLFSVAERGGAVWWDPAWELSNGYRYPGGLAAAAAVFLVVPRWRSPRLDVATLGDRLAPSLAVAMVVVRCGCLLCGCCHGTPADLPWAFAFAPHSPAWRAHLERGWITPEDTASLSVHPLQIYFALASALILGALLCLRQRTRGLLLPTYLLLDGLAKLGLESLRLQDHSALQLAAACEAAIGAGVLLAQTRNALPVSGRAGLQACPRLSCGGDRRDRPGAS